MTSFKGTQFAMAAQESITPKTRKGQPEEQSQEKWKEGLHLHGLPSGARTGSSLDFTGRGRGPISHLSAFSFHRRCWLGSELNSSNLPRDDCFPRLVDRHTKFQGWRYWGPLKMLRKSASALYFTHPATQFSKQDFSSLIMDSHMTLILG